MKNNGLNKTQKVKKNYIKPIVSRNTTILPKFIGKITFDVYNGKKVYYEILVTEEMIGHKIGEFSAYRENVFHLKKQKQKNNSKWDKKQIQIF